MRRAWLAPRVEAGEAGAGPALVNLDVLIAWALALSEVGAGRDRGEAGRPPAGA